MRTFPFAILAMFLFAGGAAAADSSPRLRALDQEGCVPAVAYLGDPASAGNGTFVDVLPVPIELSLWRCPSIIRVADAASGSPTTSVPEWIVGKFTGKQTIPGSAANEADADLVVKPDGTWTLDIKNDWVHVGIEGRVTAVTADSATLSGKYVRGRGYGNKITYEVVRQPDGTISGSAVLGGKTLTVTLTLRRP